MRFTSINFFMIALLNFCSICSNAFFLFLILAICAYPVFFNYQSCSSLVSFLFSEGNFIFSLLVVFLSFTISVEFNLISRFWNSLNFFRFLIGDRSFVSSGQNLTFPFRQPLLHSLASLLPFLLNLC